MRSQFLTATATAATAGLLLLAPSAQANPAQNTQASEIKQAYQSWIKAVQAADCDGTAVSRQYTKTAILLATFETYVQGSAALTKYFDALTCNKDLTVKTDRITTARDGQMGYATGLYTFSYVDKGGKVVKVPARFTFVFVEKDGRWSIANHHSSTQPSKATS